MAHSTEANTQKNQCLECSHHEENFKEISEESKRQEVTQDERDVQPVRNLTTKQRFCFSVGHIQNDLQAYSAFSYLLVFWSKVIGLSNSSTGIIFLVAQVTDGILSPVIGYSCDRYELPVLSRFGKRKAWHMFGTFVLLIFSPFLFVKCLLCEVTSRDDEWVAILYYSLIVIAIQFGFAAVQISHLALLPDIAKKPSDFVLLNSTRTAWTFISGIFVHGVTWLLLGESTGEKLSSKQWKEFMYLGFIITAVGFTFSVVFYIGVNENSIKKDKECTKIAGVNDKHESVCNRGYLEDETTADKQAEDILEDSEAEMSNHPDEMTKDSLKIENILEPKCMKEAQRIKPNTLPSENIKIKDWFKTSEFYMVVIIYTCSRIVVKISNSYFPLYLVDALAFEKEAIAYFPLLVLVSSALFSTVARKITSHWSSKATYTIGAVMAIGTFLWLYFQPINSKNAMYGASFLMGGGASMMLITALTVTAVMINRVDKLQATGAFVYGVMGFAEKVANGAVVAVIQKYYPRTKNGSCIGCGQYIRFAFPLVTGLSALFSLIVMVFYQRTVFDNELNASGTDSAGDEAVVKSTVESYDTRL